MVKDSRKHLNLVKGLMFQLGIPSLWEFLVDNVHFSALVNNNRALSCHVIFHLFLSVGWAQARFQINEESESLVVSLNHGTSQYYPTHQDCCPVLINRQKFLIVMLNSHGLPLRLSHQPIFLCSFMSFCLSGKDTEASLQMSLNRHICLYGKTCISDDSLTGTLNKYQPPDQNKVHSQNNVSGPLDLS